MAFKPARWPRKLRSQEWFGGSSKDAIYHGSWMKNQGLPADLLDGRPVVGICNTWSELTPCNAHLRDLAEKVKFGIYEAGGFPVEFPVFSPAESSLRPTAMMYRNLCAMDVEEAIRGMSMDGVVLLAGCDKTTPALLMAAATMNIPAIVLSGGPMLDGFFEGDNLVGSGTVIWRMRRRLGAGEITEEEFLRAAAGSAPSLGHCNTMGTASTMNAMAEALGMSLTGCSAIPAPYTERMGMAYETGKRIVEMAYEDLKPSDIMTREAFLNAIATNSAIGGSTNAQPHLHAIANHIGVDLKPSDWQVHGHDVPLLVNMQPAGTYLGERFFRAGGVPAVMAELEAAGRIHPTMTVSGKSMVENVKGRISRDREMIKSYDEPMAKKAGFVVMTGNLFDTAIMKTSVISKEFRERYLSTPGDEGAFEARAIVFEGSEDYHDRINDPSLAIDANCVLVIRGAGPIGWPGSAEVVNMQPPDSLLKQGITSLPTIGDGRQSGTADSPSILNASPEAAAGGGLAFLKTGDMLRIDLNTGRVDALVDEAEWEERKKAGPLIPPANQTPWQELARNHVTQLAQGGCIDLAVKFQNIREATPRHNH